MKQANDSTTKKATCEAKCAVTSRSCFIKHLNLLIFRFGLGNLSMDHVALLLTDDGNMVPAMAALETLLFW